MVKINIDEIGLYEEDKYYRVFVKYGTHTMHTEKLNLETAAFLLSDLLVEKKDVK